MSWRHWAASASAAIRSACAAHAVCRQRGSSTDLRAAMPLYTSAHSLCAGLCPLLLLVAQAARADLAPPPKDGYWRGTAGAALAATSGNTKTSSAVLNSD